MSASHPHALPAGRRIEQYEIVRVLGAGGFGITYLAFDHRLNGPVAIKEYFPADIAARSGDWRIDDFIVRPWRAKTAGAASEASDSRVTAAAPDQRDVFAWGLDRFVDEAASLQRFRHPNVVQAHRCIQASGTAYIVMEYVEGESLQEVLDAHGPLAPAAWRCWLNPLLDGLAHVHGQGYLHRDIKPSNIVIRAADDAPVLIDFGSARVAAREHTHTQVLTPGYAPIEQHSSEGAQGPPTDIYALAAVSYRALTGKPLSSAPDRVLRDACEPLAERITGADRRWLAAIDQGLALRPEDRPQTVTAWLEALHAADGVAVAASEERAGRAKHPSPPKHRESRTPRRGDALRESSRFPTRGGERGGHSLPRRRATSALRRLSWLAVIVVLFIARELPEFIAKQGRRVATIADEAPLVTYGVARGVAEGLTSDADDGEEADTNGRPKASPEETEAGLGLDWAGRRVIQRGLEAAGFDPGAVDGVFGPATRAAMRAYQASRGQAATGYLDDRQLIELRAAGHRWRDRFAAPRPLFEQQQSWSMPDSTAISRELDTPAPSGSGHTLVWPLSVDDRRSAVELLCEAKGPLNGAAAYSRCVEEAKRYRPDFTGVSAADRTTIELMCATDLLNGPAAYSRCVEEAKRYRPDFTGVSAADRATIELMCATDLLNGPAEYSRCIEEAKRSVKR